MTQFHLYNSFKRDAIIAHDSSVADSAEDVVAYGVASVFTPAPYRRYGYAKHMMRLLHWVLANLRFREATIFPKAWGTPPEAPDNVGNAAFSVLYSDVGAQFYESCGPSISVGGGWSVKSPVSTLWRLKAQETHESLDLGGNMVIGEWRMLRLEDLNHVWEKDAGAMRANLAKRHTTGRSPFLCAFLPSQGVTAFQIQRLVDTTARGNPLPGDTWGIENIEDGAGGPVFASWTVELKGPGPKSLVVTRLRVRPDRFPDLLKLISAEARQFEAEVIEVWNLDTELVNLAHQLGGRTIMREEHLPSLAWYGPNATADVNWAYNERYGLNVL